MTTGYRIEFNVYGRGQTSGGKSISGHMNVTFRGPDGTAITLGANQDMMGPGAIVRGHLNTNEGIIRDESGKLADRHVTRGVAVTEVQFNRIRLAAIAMLGQRYDYALVGSDSGAAQVCGTWANDIYRATGHPGNVGSLFSSNDRGNNQGPIWGWIPDAPRPQALNFFDPGVPEYVPQGPVEGHQPNVDTFVDPWRGLQNLLDGFPTDLGSAINGLKNMFNAAASARSPLILDLDGDGVETLGKSAYIQFDHDRNGFAELTGWVGPDDGLLVLDRNGNGRIDDGSELFGNHSGGNGGTEPWTTPIDEQMRPRLAVMPRDGFEALADFDYSRDGVINASDYIFDWLRVWKA